jgi:hypothetical protein
MVASLMQRLFEEDHLLTCFDDLAQAHFIRQIGAFGQWGFERAQGGFDSGRVQLTCASTSAPASLSRLDEHGTSP